LYKIKSCVNSFDFKKKRQKETKKRGKNTIYGALEDCRFFQSEGNIFVRENLQDKESILQNI
jgi:hypothetical protein